MNIQDTLNKIQESVQPIKDKIDDWKEDRAFMQRFRQVSAENFIDLYWDWMVALAYMEEFGSIAQMNLKFDVESRGYHFSQLDFLTESGERYPVHTKTREELLDVIKHIAKNNYEDLKERHPYILDKADLIEHYLKTPKDLASAREAIDATYAVLLDKNTTDIRFVNGNLHVLHTLSDSNLTKPEVPMEIKFNGNPNQDGSFPLMNALVLAEQYINEKKEQYKTQGFIFGQIEVPFEEVDNRSKFERLNEEVLSMVNDALHKAKERGADLYHKLDKFMMG